MILVLLGTSPYKFSRLARAVEDFSKESHDKIIGQFGYTNCQVDGVDCFDFLPRHELLLLIEEAELIVTQGGFGSIMDCLERRKKVVAVPRLQEFAEAQHGGLGQTELVQELEKMGQLIGVYDINELPIAINKARYLHPRLDSQSEIPNLVLNYVKSTMASFAK